MVVLLGPEINSVGEYANREVLARAVEERHPSHTWNIPVEDVRASQVRWLRQGEDLCASEWVCQLEGTSSETYFVVYDVAGVEVTRFLMSGNMSAQRDLKWPGGQLETPDFPMAADIARAIDEQPLLSLKDGCGDQKLSCIVEVENGIQSLRVRNDGVRVDFSRMGLAFPKEMSEDDQALALSLVTTGGDVTFVVGEDGGVDFLGVRLGLSDLLRRLDCATGIGEDCAEPTMAIDDGKLIRSSSGKAVWRVGDGVEYILAQGWRIVERVPWGWVGGVIGTLVIMVGLGGLLSRDGWDEGEEIGIDSQPERSAPIADDAIRSNVMFSGSPAPIDEEASKMNPEEGYFERVRLNAQSHGQRPSQSRQREEPSSRGDPGRREMPRPDPHVRVDVHVSTTKVEGVSPKAAQKIADMAYQRGVSHALKAAAEAAQTIINEATTRASASGEARGFARGAKMASKAAEEAYKRATAAVDQENVVDGEIKDDS